ncbi:serine/threonine-protein phosphatase [Thalassospiraceae bacterium LMO-JJ14]|nr:serine/threonine-protein phosphatase [Thalassospiraceae bacterium LMO-JJ14]
MEIDIGHFSCPGRNGGNQDVVLPPLFEGGYVWAAIADGVGGHVGGEVAARTAIETVKQEATQGSKAKLKSIINSAHKALVSKAETAASLTEMSTTLSIVRASRKQAEVAHIGDSRIYHLRDNGLMTRTKDQTEVNELIENRVLTKKEARRYPRRHVLLNSLSVREHSNVFETSFSVCPGDRIILLTDGVYEVLLRSEIRDLSLKSATCNELCAHIKSEIEDRGIVDDYSVCAFSIN